MAKCIIDPFRKDEWKLIICDEAHEIRNPSSHMKKAMDFLTGSKNLKDLGYVEDNDRESDEDSSSDDDSYSKTKKGRKGRAKSKESYSDSSDSDTDSSDDDRPKKVKSKKLFDLEDLADDSDEEKKKKKKRKIKMVKEKGKNDQERKKWIDELTQHGSGSIESFKLLMSGTYYWNKTQDLKSQAFLLGVKPYSTHKWWLKFGKECDAFAAWLKMFVVALKPEFIDKLLSIPPIEREIVHVHMTGKSKLIYNKLWISILQMKEQKAKLENMANSRMVTLRKDLKKTIMELVQEINNRIINRIDTLIKASNHAGVLRSELTRMLESTKEKCEDSISSKQEKRPQTEKVLQLLKEHGIEELSYKEHSDKSRAIVNSIVEFIEKYPGEKVRMFVVTTLTL
jgi:hypothetical protein